MKNATLSSHADECTSSLPHQDGMRTKNGFIPPLETFLICGKSICFCKYLRKDDLKSKRNELWPKAKHSLRAQAQLSETVTETFELVKVEQKLQDLREREKAERRNDGGARAGVTMKTSSKLIC
ncbi:hypothetical protein TNCV_2566401 [Trichonephila clavipes]|uniref:Uncharacterized protein n=1 Tax=Trichonephila clavipes TaxID=2585209 RepID=A0A8X7BNE0_TRICX|nr:hypothetical protein TNCV_2566401 [Trichonephila clavipes]